MNGMLGGLPPGLAGYVASQQMQQQQQGNQLQQLQGMLSIQGTLEKQKALQGLIPQLNDPAARLLAQSGDIGGAIKRQFPTPQSPQLVEIPIAGKPGVSQKQWVIPGQTSGLPIGGEKAPDILNPDVFDARKRLAQESRPQVNTQVNVPPPSKVFENENKLRDDYVTASKPFVGLRDAYNTVQASLSGPITAASTLAGATKFMKLIDPESVVRESELQLALKATGMLDRFLNLHNTVLKGQVLTPTQASEIKNIADVLYAAAEKQQKQTDDYFGGLATQYGLEPTRVIRNQSAVMKTDADVYDAADAILRGKK